MSTHSSYDGILIMLIGAVATVVSLIAMIIVGLVQQTWEAWAVGGGITLALLLATVLYLRTI